MERRTEFNESTINSGITQPLQVLPWCSLFIWNTLCASCKYSGGRTFSLQWGECKRGCAEQWVLIVCPTLQCWTYTKSEWKKNLRSV